MKKRIYLLLVVISTCVTFSAKAQYSSLSFDVLNSYLTIPDNSSFNVTEFTIETWFKWQSTGGGADFICSKSGSGIEIHTNTNNSLRFLPVPGLYFDTDPNTISQNTWIHVACVYNPSVSLAKVYINGVDMTLTQLGVNPINTPIVATSNPFLIGSRIPNGYPFLGKIDEFRVWNRVLTQADIQYTMNCEIPTIADGLIVNHHFNQGIADGDNTGITTLTDSSGYSNNATLVNFTMNGTTSNLVNSSAVASGTFCSVAAPSVSNQTFTIGATVADLVATGTSLKWYTTASGGSVLASSTVLASGNYYVSQTLYGLESNRVAVTVTIVLPGAALSFDGVDDIVAIPNSASFNVNAFTIETWFKWDHTTGVEFICSKGTSTMEIHTIGSNSLRFIPVAGLNLDAPTNAITSGTWNHVACVYDPSVSLAKMYINGVEVALTQSGGNPLNTTIISNTGAFTIGRRTDLSLPFYGQIDELRVWNRALSLFEILGKMNCEIAIPETGLIVNQHFNQGIGEGNNTAIATITDASGNNNNGTLTNFAMTGATSNFVSVGGVTSGISCIETSDQTFCAGATVADLVATGTAIKWYDAASGGTALVSTTQLQSQIYYATQTINSIESNRISAIITIFGNAASPYGANNQVYAGTTATLASLTVTGTAIKWYNVPAGGTLLANTTVLTEGATYYASQTTACGESVARLAVTVHKISEDTQIFCEGATASNLVSTPSATATTSWYTTPANGTALINTDVLASGNYYIAQTVPQNTATIATYGGSNSIPSVAVQTDGKIVVADYDNQAIHRMNPDGSGTETFNLGLYPTSVAVQSDGKILVAGLIGLNKYLKRLNADGSGMVTLYTSSSANIQGIALQSNGKIIMTQGTQINRINADGTGLVTLHSSSIYPFAVAVQPDGKIVIADINDNTIKRMNSDGTNIVTLASFSGPLGVAIQADGKIIVADNGGSNSIKRINADGTNIETLGSGFNSPWGVAVQADGKILVGCGGTVSLKRITPVSVSNRAAVNVVVNATLTPITYAQTFCAGVTVANLVAIGTNIKWYDVATGGTPLADTLPIYNTTYYVSQTLNSCESPRTASSVFIFSGTLPPTGLSTQLFTDTTTTLASLTVIGTAIKWYNALSGGTLLANTTVLTNGTTYYASQTTACGESVARLSVTVHKISEDTQTFCVGATVNNLVSTPSASATASWYTTPANGTALLNTDVLAAGNYYIAQTLPQNTATIATYTGSNSIPSVAVQTDGKILVADYDNQAIHRMNPDGSGAETFNLGLYPTCVAVQSDGKILVAGLIGLNKYIKRLNADGSGIVTIFTSSSGNIQGIALQSNGKIVMIQGTQINRINADGTGLITLSTAFNLPYALAVQADGKIIIADINDNTIKRINSNGSNIVTLASGFSGPLGVAIQADGKIIVADNGGSNSIKRMNADGTNIETLSSGINSPWGVAVQADGKILVGGASPVSLKRITPVNVSNRAVVNVVVNTSTPAPTASAQTLSSNDKVANLVATGTNLKWYDVATGGTALATSTPLNTGIYYVSQTIGCESPRTAVNVTVYIVGAALSFDGINDYFAIPNNATFNVNAFTIETWFKWGHTGTIEFLCSKGSAIMEIQTNTNNSLRFIPVTGVFLDGPANSITTGIWTHVACVYDPSPSLAKMYINGVEVGLTLSGYNPINTNITANTDSLGVGMRIGGGYNFYGELDEFKLWNRALTQAEVQNIMNCEIADSYNGLIVNQHFNQGIGEGNNTAITTITDASGNNNNGTLTNFTMTGAVSNLISVGAVTSGVSCVTNLIVATTQNFCNSATVANLVATGTNIKWFNVASGGSPLAGTTALATGNYYVSQTFNNIETARTSVSVTINITPAPTASAQTLCSILTVADLVATGTDLKWYSVATNGTALLPTTALVTGTYYISQTLNTCESVRTLVNVTLTVTPLPTASNQSFNVGATVANLVATGTALQWFDVATGGTPLVTSTILLNGTYYVSQTISGCLSERTAVIVTITTAAPTASNQGFCEGATVANLVASGSNLNWYNVSLGGTPLVGTTILTSGNYYVSQTISGTESARTTVVVAITTSAPTPTGIYIQVYAGTATLASLSVTGTNIKWYDAPTGGTLLASTTALVDGTTYYAAQTITTCESLNRLAVTAKKISESTQTFCDSSKVANLASTPSAGGVTSWYSVAVGGSALPTSTNVSSGTYFVEQLNPPYIQTLATGFVQPNGVALDAAGNIYVADHLNQVIRKLNASGNIIATYSTQYQYPDRVFVDALGYIYFSTSTNIFKMNPTGSSFTDALGFPVYYISDFAVDASGNVFITNQVGNTISKFNSSNNTITLLASGLIRPYAIALDAAGNIYFGEDAANRPVFKMDGAGNNIVALGNGFDKIFSLALDSTGNIYVGVYGGNKPVYKMDPSGANIINLGSGFTFATEIAIDESENIFIVSFNGILKKMKKATPSNRVAANIVIHSTPAPTASAQSFNAGATVANLVATGTALQWYNVATGGTALATSATLVSGTYYVTQTLNACSSNRLAVSVTIIPVNATALHFDGVDDYVAIADNSTFNVTAFTIETWFKWEHTGTIDFICSKGSSIIEIQTNTDNSLRFIPVAGVYLDGPPNSIATGTWTHVACVYDPTINLAKMYINGVEITLTLSGYNPINTIITANTAPLGIGSRIGDGYPYYGSLDEFRLWNRVLTQTEIQNKMNCETANTDNGLIVNLHFNQGIGEANNTAITTIIDASGNNNSGTLTNFAMTGITSNLVSVGAVTTGVSCTYTWTGTTNTDWNTTSNWDVASIPTAINDVIIPVVTNFPIVNELAGSPALCNNLTINTGATLTIAANKALTIGGNITNNGTFTINSNATGTATLLNTGTITGTGTYTAQQYLTGAGGATPTGAQWYVSSPVVGATSNTFDAGGGNKAWSYNENAGAYSEITDNATTLTTAMGYNARLGATTTVEFTSTSGFNTGNISTSTLTKRVTGINRGFNLVGNPYPSHLNWELVDTTNFSSTIWYRTRNGGGTQLFDTYNGVSHIGTNNNGNGAVTQYIPPAQAVWVKVTGSNSTMNFTNTMRSHQASNLLHKTENVAELIRLKIADGNNNSDETVINFNANASNIFDAFDSQKQWGPATIPQLYTTTSKDTLVINTLNNLTENTVVDLGIISPKPGQYSITATENGLILPAILWDKTMDIKQDLSLNPVYTFDCSSGMNNGNRFALLFAAKTTGINSFEATANAVQVYQNTDNIIVEFKGSNVPRGIITVYDITGRKVFSQAISNKINSLTMQNATGVYMVQIQTAEEVINKKVVLN